MWNSALLCSYLPLSCTDDDTGELFNNILVYQASFVPRSSFSLIVCILWLKFFCLPMSKKLESLSRSDSMTIAGQWYVGAARVYSADTDDLCIL